MDNVKCKMGVALLPCMKTSNRAECPFCSRLVYLEVLFSETYFPDESLKIKLIPTPNSSTPISNGELFHLRKMSRCGHVPIFPYWLAGHTKNPLDKPGTTTTN